MIFLFFRTPLLELLNHPFMSPLLILSLDQLKVSFLLRFVPLLAYSPLTAYAGYRLRLPYRMESFHSLSALKPGTRAIT